MPHQESEKSSLDANGSPASSPTTPTENTDTRDERLRAPQQQQSNEELPVPLGGTRAWLQVVGGFFAFINIWFVYKPIHVTFVLGDEVLTK